MTDHTDVPKKTKPVPATDFSIVVATHNRVLDGLLRRALLSVLNQTYERWECIVVDDGSSEPVEKVVESIRDPRFRLVTLEKHGERVKAWNAGFEAAAGEWICMLCSDDIYLPHFLRVLKQAMEKHPEASIFNFQELNIRHDARIWTRNLFTPKKLAKGHEGFCSGKISMGNFIFEKECLDVIGKFPDVSNFWKFADIARDRYPWIKEHCYKGELGNPWGEDFYLFFALTREYHSVPLPVTLMAKYPIKGGRLWFQGATQEAAQEAAQKAV